MFAINLRGQTEVRVGRHKGMSSSDMHRNVADTVALLLSASPLLSSQGTNLNQSLIHAFMYSFTHHTFNEYQVTQYRILDSENTKMSRI